MSTATMSLELLKEIPLFEALLQDGQECPAFVYEGREMIVTPGQRLVEEGDPGAFYVVLEGRLQVLKKTSEGEMLVAIHQPGSFFGEMPLLLGTGFIAAGKAESEAKVWVLPEDAFWRMLSSCPSVTRQIMQTMASRVKNLESMAQGHERLLSLGTMAAGLSHELNNPAAGARHAARELKIAAADFPGLACELHKQELNEEHLEFLVELGDQMAALSGKEPDLTPMQRSDLEEEIGIWLEDRGMDDGFELSPILVSASLDVEWLDCVQQRVPEPAFGAVIRWLCGTITVNGSVAAIDEATRRISDLVGAVKTFSHLDRSPVGEVNVREGLESTIRMLTHKLKRFEVCKEIDPKLTPIWGYAGELNQVWTNLLDNAADALGDKSDGRILIRAYCDTDGVTVEIEDNGTGIHPDVQKRLFEPFYTTKGVGKGTGLGLATAYRIVHGQHGGDIVVDSEPGHTVFRVMLPTGNGMVSLDNPPPRAPNFA